MSNMAESRSTESRRGTIGIVQTLATTETREHLLARRTLDGNTEDVVVLRLTPRASQTGDFVEIYLAEARHASQLDHENVVRILSVSDEPPDYEIVYEYVRDALPLDRILRVLKKRGEVMPVEHALTLLLDVCAAIAHAHGVRDPELGTCVLHQDLSPENVLLDTDGRAKVTDFGVGRASRISSMTVVGGRQRRLGRLSPEQLVGRTVDERSDIFGLGVMAYETTVGMPPFQGDSDFELMASIDDGRYTPPSARVTGYLPALEAVVTRALATKPDDRFQSAAELRAALASIRDGCGGVPSRSALRAWAEGRFGEEASAATEPAPSRPPRPPPQPPPQPPPRDEGPRRGVRAQPKRRGFVRWLRRLLGGRG
jgi:serine/threonine protein kinase